MGVEYAVSGNTTVCFPLKISRAVGKVGESKRPFVCPVPGWWSQLKGPYVALTPQVGYTPGLGSLCLSVYLSLPVSLSPRPVPEQAPLPPWLIVGRPSRGDLASINRHEGNSPASNINTETGCAATEARPELVRAPQALRDPQRRLFNTQILLEEFWPQFSRWPV